MPGSILIIPYDPRWPVMFEGLRRCLSVALGDVAMTIEHVGSTAVSGLAGKPILDIDVVVRSAPEVAEAIRRLGEFGYQHLGDLGVRGREALPVLAILLHTISMCWFREASLFGTTYNSETIYGRTHLSRMITSASSKGSQSSSRMTEMVTLRERRSS